MQMLLDGLTLNLVHTRLSQMEPLAIPNTKDMRENQPLFSVNRHTNNNIRCLSTLDIRIIIRHYETCMFMMIYAYLWRYKNE